MHLYVSCFPSWFALHNYLNTLHLYIFYYTNKNITKQSNFRLPVSQEAQVTLHCCTMHPHLWSPVLPNAQHEYVCLFLIALHCLSMLIAVCVWEKIGSFQQNFQSLFWCQGTDKETYVPLVTISHETNPTVYFSSYLVMNWGDLHLFFNIMEGHI